jgi:hypothetical protein
MLCSELVNVHFRSRTGRNRRIAANLEDISLSGACVQVEEPIPANTLLRICHPKGEFEGTVRYCIFRKIGYFLGVQFQPGCGWSPEIYQPQHLLDLRALVWRSARRAEQRRGDEPAVQ